LPVLRGKMVKDKAKVNEQLIKELRQRIAELEKSEIQCKGAEKNAAREN
jgi:hypothetical protein